MKDPIISVKNLTKTFGEVVAVDNITFDVKKGEIFGFLGPNGAGKTTTLRMLTTLLTPDSGEIQVSGFNPKKDADELKHRVGLVAEKLIMYDYLTASENLRFFGRLYNVKKDILESRIEELLKKIGMWKWRNYKIGTYSSGMKQRINVIRALVTDPDIIFMDEPTLGLDPQSTRKVREFIRELNKKGKTIILTTHIMQEADLLSDRVGIIDKGKIVALDTPENLKKILSDKKGSCIELTLSSLPEDLKAEIEKLKQVKVEVMSRNRLAIEFTNGMKLNELIDIVQKRGLTIMKLQTYDPTLEDVFIELTGKQLRDKADQKVATQQMGPRHMLEKQNSRIR